MRRSLSPFRLVPALVVAASSFSPMANATAQRTFVASYGLTANTAFNCSIAKPCRAFSEAIGVTNPKGEVIVLDSAGYGPVTITKSVSIIAPPGIYAGISVFSFDGVTINAGAGDIVVLRGLSINGQGGSTGVNFETGSRLFVEDCRISGLGTGINAVAVNSTTTVRNTVLIDNDSSVFTNSFAAESVIVTIEGAQISNNTVAGIYAGAGSRVTVSDSVITDNLRGALSAAFTSQATSLFVTRSTFSGNTTAFEVSASPGSTASIVADANSITYDSNAAFAFDGAGGTEVIYTRNNNSAGYFGSSVTGGSLTPLPAL